MLIKLLEKQSDPQTVSIAAHDIGEYVHFHPRGKYLVEQLGGKQLLMQHLTNEDPSVKYAALIAIQKLMVHNWYANPFERLLSHFCTLVLYL